MSARPRVGNLGGRRQSAIFAKRWPLDLYPRLLAAFIAHLNHDRAPQRPQELWFRFLFALQLDTGLGTPANRDELQELTVAHLNDLAAGWLWLPRWGGRVPHPLTPLAVACGLALLLTLRRAAPQGGRGRPGPLDPTRRLVDCLPDAPADLPGAYRAWRTALARAASGQSRTLSDRDFQSLVETEFHGWLEPELFEILTGRWFANPAPLAQQPDFADLAGVIDLARAAAHPPPPPPEAAGRVPAKLRRAPGEPASPGNTRREQSAIEVVLRSALRPLAWLARLPPSRHADDRAERRRVRAAVRADLRRLASRIEARFGPPPAPGAWAAWVAGLGHLTPADRQALTLAAAARWLAEQLRRAEHPPHQSLGMQITWLLRSLDQCPAHLPHELGPAELAVVHTDPEFSPATRHGQLQTLHNYQAFAAAELGATPPAGSHWGALLAQTWVTQSVAFLTVAQYEQLHAALLAADARGQLAACAMLLQSEFGLRPSSALRIRIDALRITPAGATLAVLPIKKSAGRDLYIPITPANRSTFARLAEFQRQRLAETGGQRRRALLAGADGRWLRLDEYSALLLAAADRLGIALPHRTHRQVTHVFRHFAANRWLAAGLSIRQIRDRLNHRQDSTSVASYLHGLAFVLADRLADRPEAQPVQLSRTAAAYLLGYAGDRQLRNRLSGGRAGRLTLAQFCALAAQQLADAETEAP